MLDTTISMTLPPPKLQQIFCVAKIIHAKISRLVILTSCTRDLNQVQQHLSVQTLKRSSKENISQPFASRLSRLPVNICFFVIFFSESII
ncbi:hypothetical protein Patl1_09767 [Pistacia atlantica]|uniref:Uncharacterized protein n=1 Tax=Pistacia atlantica TaxID=434234 RepID=A0ACC1A1P5_9ROSI|nr:hypothetical protein Patl1_09767 [Pistacia atlantica]